MSTKHGHTIYENEILDEFDYGSNPNCCIRLCLLSNIYKYKQISTKLGHNEYECKMSDGFDYGSSHTRSVGVLSP